MRKLLLLFVAMAAVGAVTSACGGGGSSTPSTMTSAAPPPAPTTSTGASIGTRSGPLGTYLVDAQGRTLYLFQADKGTQSTCNGACASVWPPIPTTGQPAGGPGLNASQLGTTTRSDGKLQVTYNGHPLYTYVGDSNAGSTNGQGLDQFGALWYVVSPSGNAITASGQGPGARSTQTTPPAGGY